MPISELEVKTIRLAHSPWSDPADTIAIRDTDDREIIIRRIQIKELIKKLREEQ